MRTVNSFIGSPIERLEDLRFLRGRGEYVDDLTRPGMLHAAILRSAVAHGRIRSIDVARALAMPGVHGVITARDLGSRSRWCPCGCSRCRNSSRSPSRSSPMTRSAMWARRSPSCWPRARRSPRMPWRRSRSTSKRCRRWPIGAPRRRTNRSCSRRPAAISRSSSTPSWATPPRPSARAAYTRRESFRVQRHMAHADGDARPARAMGCGARAAHRAWRRQGAVLQPPHARQAIGSRRGRRRSGRERRRRRFRRPRRVLSGGFPHSVRGPPGRAAGEMDRGSPRAAHDRQSRARAGMRHRDRLRARRHHPGIARPRLFDVGAYMRTNGAVSARNVAQFMSGPYRIPEHRYRCGVAADQQDAGRNLSRARAGSRPISFASGSSTWWRAISASTASNFAGAISSPKPSCPIRSPPSRPTKARTQFDSGDYQVTLDRCLAEIGWAEKAKLQGKLIEGRHHGLALGCFVEGGAAGPKESARLVLETDGSFTVYVGSSAVGQGLETVFAQIAADALEMPMERIRGVFHGSTSCVSDGYGAYHSRSVVMGGSAILAAAVGLREAIRACAAQRLGCTPAEVTLLDDKAQGPAGRAHRACRARGRSHLVRGRLPQQEAHLRVRSPCGPCRGRSQARSCASLSTTWRWRIAGASSIR